MGRGCIGELRHICNAERGLFRRLEVRFGLGRESEVGFSHERRLSVSQISSIGQR